MSCITKLLEMKGDQPFLFAYDGVVIEGGGKYQGYEYLITFTDWGHRCGYVALQSDDSYDPDEINCHGGITFEGREHAAKDLLSIPCNDTWIGFDAGHGYDFPCYETLKRYFGNDEKILDRAKLIEEVYGDSTYLYPQNKPIGKHRTFEYMTEQCKNIIDQLIERAA